jgi:ribose transport system ATP-binding protein
MTTVGAPPPRLALDGIVKSFDGNEVLHGVSLSVAAGEFVGLVGPNGAGKSTLIKILDGVYTADSGTITIDGKRVEQRELGEHVGVVHQSLGLVETMTVADNICLALPPQRAVGPLLSPRRERVLVREALDLVGMRNVHGRDLVSDLALGERALVAVARLLARGANIVIVDEVTSALPQADVDMLLDRLKRRAATGATIIMVSHRLAEIVTATDRQVVLVDGRVAADTRGALRDVEQLAQLMSSHEAATSGASGPSSVPTASPPPRGEELLVLDAAHSGIYGPFSLSVRAGEAVGVTGPLGMGLYAVAYLASGLTSPDAGEARLGTARPGFVVPDRETEGTFPEETVQTNMTIASLRRWRGKFGLLHSAVERAAAAEQRDRLHVVPPSLRTRQKLLSGGNQQKVLFGRALLCQTKVLVLCEPTRGIDVATRRQIYQLIGELKGDGYAILIVSTDAEDLLAVCDRVGIVDDGALESVMPISEMALAKVV